jgi:hypothetical protein
MDTQPPKLPKHWHMYSVCASSDRSIALLITHAYLQQPLIKVSAAARAVLTLAGVCTHTAPTISDR